MHSRLWISKAERVAIIPSDFMKEPRCAVELYTAEEMSSFDVTTELKYIYHIAHLDYLQPQRICRTNECLHFLYSRRFQSSAAYELYHNPSILFPSPVTWVGMGNESYLQSSNQVAEDQKQNKSMTDRRPELVYDLFLFSLLILSSKAPRNQRARIGTGTFSIAD